MNNDKAILVVSFGTSYVEALNKTISKIEEDIQNKFTDYKVFHAFTSKMIIKKLESNNFYVNSVIKAIEEMIDQNVKELIVQPTHVINGLENTLMINEIKNYSNQFDSIKIGKPLLSSTYDCQKLTDILSNEFSYLKSDEVLVCMGHGTSNQANAAYLTLNNTLKDLGYKNIHIGTMKGSQNLDTIIKKLKQDNLKKVTLFPLMIVAGNHAINDMSSDKENSWKSILLNNGFQVKCVIKGLGEIKAIREMIIEHLNNVIE